MRQSHRKCPSDPRRFGLQQTDCRRSKGTFVISTPGDEIVSPRIQVKAGTHVRPTKVTAAGYMGERLDGLRLRDTTVALYRRLNRLHVEPHIGSVRLDVEPVQSPVQRHSCIPEAQPVQPLPHVAGSRDFGRPHMGAGLNLCPRVEEGISRRFAGEETNLRLTSSAPPFPSGAVKSIRYRVPPLVE